MILPTTLASYLSSVRILHLERRHGHEGEIAVVITDPLGREVITWLVGCAQALGAGIGDVLAIHDNSYPYLPTYLPDLPAAHYLDFPNRSPYGLLRNFPYHLTTLPYGPWKLFAPYQDRLMSYIS